MKEYFMDTGPWGIFNFIIWFFIAVFGLKNAYMLYIRKPKENLSRLGRSINTMLFWGAISVILCFLGTFVAFQSIISAVMDSHSHRQAIEAKTNSLNIQYVESREKMDSLLEMYSKSDSLSVYVVENREDMKKLQNMDPKPDIIMQAGVGPAREGFVDTGLILVTMGGVHQVLTLVISTLLVFTIICVVWYQFLNRHRKLLERSMKEKYSAE
ncbi:hypothetical protein ACFL2X_04565 [Candidatus Latescibacterota bacterium]